MSRVYLILRTVMSMLIVCGVILNSALEITSFSPSTQIISHHVGATRARTSSSLPMGLFDDILNPSSLSKPSYPKVEVPPDFEIPEPKPLTITPSSDVSSILKSSIALALRLATSAFVLGWQIDTLFYKDTEEEDGSSNTSTNTSPKKYALPLFLGINIRDSSSVLVDAPRPKEPLIIYEYDASPYCKRVREMVNILDLTVEYRPCPGARQSMFSKDLLEKTGKQTVPYLIDPNTNVGMFESNDIINYLVSTYGPNESSYDGKALWPITFEQFSIVTSTMAAILTGLPASQRQENARPDNEQMKPLELWGYECSPFCFPVREKLCALALPHLMVSCSRGSKNRDLLVEKTGTRFQVPYLVDPNTNISMFESAEICKYLDAVYTVKNED